eukprot:TRINITY_DN45367_c0_g1_i1.p1 TRINITY_DN45367_c0_g1~~TRINITY_DN45367_c0_g1_i1.p1  ORF type:complete len:174 (+),score=29.14 TRINITY_DN45367_c0_g1_i1:53-523(+)
MGVDAEQVEEWADAVFESMGKEPNWSICQVRCKEACCPPVETILTDLNVKNPCPGKGVYKIFKPIPDVTQADVEAVLSLPPVAADSSHTTSGRGDDSHLDSARGAGNHGPQGDGHGDGMSHASEAGHGDDGCEQQHQDNCCEGGHAHSSEGHGSGH